MRVFLAIGLPDEVRERLADLAAALPVGRPVAEENLHLTLAFLDEQEMPELEALDTELSDLQAAPFELTLSGLGSFGGTTPRAVFADVLPSPPLVALHDQVRGAVRRSGIELKRERYRPHVTLARFKRGLPPGAVAGLDKFFAENAAFRLQPFMVTSFGLYRSYLRHEGPIYEELESYGFAGIPSAEP